jgi:16S rRNA processing protein RimM
LDPISPGYVAVGRTLRAHGVYGELIVEPLAPHESLSAGTLVTISGREYEIANARSEGRFLRVELAGVDTREKAQMLRGAYLQVREVDLAALPEGEYYRFQLIGLAVRSTDGRELGRVTDVLSAPENDIYVVSGPSGEVLIPAVDDVVHDIDLAGGAITVEIMPGLLP